MLRYCPLSSLCHPNEPHVEVGIDLTEYYISVEWDILRVPAERHVKVYACCPEPYPGINKFFRVIDKQRQFILTATVITRPKVSRCGRGQDSQNF